MPNIKRKVDVVSVQINSLSGQVTPSFDQLLSCIEANEYYVNGKLFELSVLDSEAPGANRQPINTLLNSSNSRVITFIVFKQIVFVWQKCKYIA